MSFLDVGGEELEFIDVLELVLVACHLLDEGGDVVEEILAGGALCFFGEVDEVFLGGCHVGFKYRFEIIDIIWRRQ